jgi:hypothetical protein
VRRLKPVLLRTETSLVRQRMQMVLLREAGVTQPAIAETMGVSLSTVNPAHMVVDRGRLVALILCPIIVAIRQLRSLSLERERSCAPMPAASAVSAYARLSAVAVVPQT